VDLNKTFKTDIELENKGTWVEVGNGCELLLGRVGGDNYNKVFGEISKPYRLQIRTSTLSDADADSILTESIARAVLLDWKGLFIDEEELEYSVDNAIKVLTEYKDFKKLVTELASDIEQYRVSEEEQASGNLEMPLDGD